MPIRDDKAEERTMKPHRKDIHRLWKFHSTWEGHVPPKWELVRRYDTRKGAEQAMKADMTQTGFHLSVNTLRDMMGQPRQPIVVPFYWIGERPPQTDYEAQPKKFPKRPKRPAAQPILVDKP